MPGPAAFRTLKQAARSLVAASPQSVRELPGRTVRVTVIGLGRGLLLADRAREELKEVRRAGVGPTVTRLRTEGVSAFGRGPTTEPPDVQKTESREAPPRSEAPPEPAAGGTTPKAGDLPVPNYDDLSLASLRARLRNLTVEQVEQLRDYERSNANRHSIVTMYDNRIAKLRTP